MTDSDIQKQWVWRGLQLPEGWPEQRNRRLATHVYPIMLERTENFP
jgi:hypothetical protein